MPHWLAFKHLLQYLKSSSSLSIVFGGHSLDLITYTDADYAYFKDTQRLVTGYMTMIGISFINWKGKKQENVSNSSCEAEYKAQFEGMKDLISTVVLLKDRNVLSAYPLELKGDNQGAIALAHNPQVHEKTKHFDTVLHCNQKMIQLRNIDITYIPTGEIPADRLTKSLPQPEHEKFMNKLCLMVQ
ncbi:hypothetical protein O181_023521 [Austropuccinia psidii MF-1]|uniref:Copia protein n=1 Tax=Austropuccinia psidii MF-1 TaxID=1389203 RepID=A0A9Q3GXQ9_9BASI|nr:hypothetical protein [Austropuccinia psidii MF-1]